MPSQLAVFGAGGHGREIAWWAGSQPGEGGVEIVAVIDDAPTAPPHRLSAPRMSWDAFHAQYPGVAVAIGIGDPATRTRVAARVAAAGHPTPAVLHHSTLRAPSARLADGCIVFPHCVLSVDADLAPHVHLNLGCTVSHDVSIGAFSTLSPGVRVCGNVRIGAGVFVGANATIINGRSDAPLTIGDGAVIAAGACVIGPVPPGAMVAGVPAVLKRGPA